MDSVDPACPCVISVLLEEGDPVLGVTQTPWLHLSCGPVILGSISYLPSHLQSGPLWRVHVLLSAPLTNLYFIKPHLALLISLRQIQAQSLLVHPLGLCHESLVSSSFTAVGTM